MNDYADTGFICSLFVPDANTDRALDWIEKQRQPICFSWLNQVEFRNALRLRIFRKEISVAERDRSLNLLLSDLNEGIFKHVEVAQSPLLIETERLSAGHSEKLGTSSLDVLHVAMAVILGCQRFFSFDRRQVKLAKAAGLATLAEWQSPEALAKGDEEPSPVGIEPTTTRLEV